MFFPGLTPISSSSRTVFSVAGASPLSSLNDLSISSGGQRSSGTTTGSPSKKRSRPPPLPFRLPTEDEEKHERESGVAGTSSGMIGVASGGSGGSSGVAPLTSEDHPMAAVTMGSPSKLGATQFIKRRSLDNKEATMKTISRLLAFGGHVPKEAVKKIYPDYCIEKERQNDVS